VRLSASLRLAAAVAVTAALGVSAASAFVGRDGDPASQSAVATPGSDSIDQSAPDAQGGPAWAVRVYEGEGGGACAELGRLRDGVFGQLDAEGTLDAVPLDEGGTCGDPAAEPVVLAINRYRARGDRGPRTVIFGRASPEVAGVAVRRPGEPGPTWLSHGPRGAFVLPLAGLTAPRELPVTITLRDGRRIVLDWT
jgi:hypothetical protein